MTISPGAKKSGGALVYGIVIMGVVQIMLVSIVQYVTSNVQYSFNIRSREQALQIAEAGIDFYRWYLAHNVEGRTATQIQSFWDGGTAYGVGTAYEADYADPSGATTGRYQIEVTPPVSGSTAVIVKSTAWTYKHPNVKRTIQVRLRLPSWSEYSVLSNDFIRFGSGTEVFGKIHSNYGIRFDGIAHNTVSSAVSTYNDPDHTGGDEFGVHTHNPVDPLPPASVPDKPAVFEAGRVFPTQTADFNGVLANLSLMKTIAQSGVNDSRYFNNSHQGRHIILKSNDTFDVRTVQSFNASTNEINNYSGGWSNYAIPNDGVIYVENNAWVEGTVNGRRVTIVAANLVSSSQKTMYLGKDIRYTNYDCTDMIGLIGQNDVEVYRQSNNVLRLDAALIAQTGRVGRANYTGTYATRDTITIYGAIASNERYGFAWADMMGNHVSGYQNRNLYYDNNLLYCPPPYFPTGTQYELDLWEEL
ncbi:MAG: hypothetical protein E6Q06_01120 [Candidatus Moraniibacteriota bacterium]|nr:MAG: hypothetical protein E6Q06_01120 [Candidatus Moranbacteria bacterium]